MAARQHGVVARRQLGLGSAAVQRRVDGGRLLRLYRGVYAVGHRKLRREGWWMAAVLAMGEGAVLSHRDAAALHGVRWPHDGATDVSVPAKRAAPRGIRLHQARTLEAADTTTHAGIPVTSVARTLVDLAGAVQPHQLAKALNEAERMGIFDLGAIEAAAARVRTRRGRGHAELRAALDQLATHGVQLTRWELEDRFRALCAARRLPPASLNASIEGFEVDAVWHRQRLAVELDGWDSHRTRDAFQRDRAKGNALTQAGWTVLRFTYADVVHRAAGVAAQIGRALRNEA